MPQAGEHRLFRSGIRRLFLDPDLLQPYQAVTRSDDRITLAVEADLARHGRELALEA